MIIKIARAKRQNYCLDHFHRCDNCEMESTPESCADYSADECVDLPCVECQNIIDEGEHEMEEPEIMTAYMRGADNNLIDMDALPDRPVIVTLCGSTRFYEEFQEANFNETLDGKIVLSVGFYPHAQNKAHGAHVGVSEEQKKMLDELHKRKIDLSDEILILNVDGYVGESTRGEIVYALKNDKRIRWLESAHIPDWYNERLSILRKG